MSGLTLQPQVGKQRHKGVKELGKSSLQEPKSTSCVLWLREPTFLPARQDILVLFYLV
jgi:hypothetical protein